MVAALGADGGNQAIMATLVVAVYLPPELALLVPVTENHLLVGAQNREMKILVHHPLKRRLTILIYLRITVLATQLPKHQAAR